MGLTPDETSYYARHLILPEIGIAGQEKLKRSSVLVIGLGGLGSPLALYLAGAGVGRLGLVEFDQVESSNLHRQILYGHSLKGQDKLAAGTARLRDLNPYIQIEPHFAAIGESNVRELIGRYDLIADGTDNFETRYLVNDACVLENKPLVSASILRFEGQLSVFNFEGGPCYRCLFPEPPPDGMAPSCAEAGVLGALPGVMGSLQAVEVIKALLKTGEVASGKLLSYDALSSSLRTLTFSRSPDCAVCGDRPTIREAKARGAGCGPVREISVADLRRHLENFTIIDVREDHERAKSRIEPSLHIPLKHLLAGDSTIPAGKPIVIYCASGKRSQTAARFLLSKGFPEVASLAGGISEWLNRR